MRQGFRGRRCFPSGARFAGLSDRTVQPQPVAVQHDVQCLLRACTVQHSIYRGMRASCTPVCPGRIQSTMASRNAQHAMCRIVDPPLAIASAHPPCLRSPCLMPLAMLRSATRHAGFGPRSLGWSMAAAAALPAKCSMFRTRSRAHKRSFMFGCRLSRCMLLGRPRRSRCTANCVTPSAQTRKRRTS